MKHFPFIEKKLEKFDLLKRNKNNPTTLMNFFELMSVIFLSQTAIYSFASPVNYSHFSCNSTIDNFLGSLKSLSLK